MATLRKSFIGLMLNFSSKVVILVDMSKMLETLKKMTKCPRGALLLEELFAGNQVDVYRTLLFPWRATPKP